MRSALAAGVLVGGLASANGARAEPFAYVALANARKVAVIDVGAGRAERAFAVPVSPHGIAASRDSRLLFVPDLLQVKFILVLDAMTGREIRRVDVGAPVHHLTLAPDGGRLYATMTAAGRLAVVELRTWRVRTVEVGGAPDYAVAAPDGRTLYVSDLAGSALAVVDPAAAQVRSRIAVTDGPGHGVIALGGSRGFFTAAAQGAV